MAVIDISLRKESRDRYLTYALSVVSGRALPDVRDGLKPVQRRILYAMFQHLKLRPDASYKKSAAVVGEVLARFHPHGDIACYEAMVRMAQDFSLRYPLVDGQGNFGSLDGDNAAAYRYTEAKLLPMALEVIGEINEDTVEFVDNFDASVTEPTVLPSRVPNLLMNGAAGIAVGMATNIPPHNLRDTIKAALTLLDDPEITIPRLTTCIKGPDFPTGCAIINTKKELNAIYQSGKGGVRMRGTWQIEEEKRGKQQIVVDTIPYGVNKSQLVEKIANLILEKKVPQLLDVRDESTEKIRVVLELAADANAEVAMAFLFKHTPLEHTFQVNLTCLAPTGENGAIRPELLSLKQMLQHFLDFRREVVVRRLEFEKKNLLDRIHILEGFAIIFDALDEAIKIVRKSSGRSDAAEKLRKRFKLSEVQAFAIVDLRIYQLSKTNIEDVRTELEEKKKRVTQINAILKSESKITGLIKSDLEAVQAEFGDNRRSKIVEEEEPIELNESDYVVQEEVFAIVTEDGWVKRIRQTNDYSSTRIREGDQILRAHPLSTVDYVCFVTSLGYLYTLRVTDFPSSSGYGSPLSKLLKLRDGEILVDSFGLESPDFEPAESDYDHMIRDGQVLYLVSKKGVGFGIVLESLVGIKRNGKRLMKFRAKDSLAAVSKGDSLLAMFTKQGSALVVSSKEVPERSQAAVGVSLMGVRKDDEVVAIETFARKCDFEIEPSSGKLKKISSSKLTKGRRGLKGTKVIARGGIARVRKV